MLHIGLDSLQPLIMIEILTGRALLRLTVIWTSRSPNTDFAAFQSGLLRFCFQRRRQKVVPLF